MLSLETFCTRRHRICSFYASNPCRQSVSTEDYSRRMNLYNWIILPFGQNLLTGGCNNAGLITEMQKTVVSKKCIVSSSLHLPGISRS